MIEEKNKEETKPVPETDNAPAADNHAGVSEQNNADAVIGLDDQIRILKDKAAEYKPETDEERRKRERREKSAKIVTAVTDGLGALSNLYFTSRGAPNMYEHKEMSSLSPLQNRLQKLKEERQANADKYLQYSLKIGDLQNQRAKTLRELEAEQERRRLAREKAEREKEEHGWNADLQPDKKREQAGKAKKAEQDAITAEEIAKNAPKMQEAKLKTEEERAKSHKASAANSYASAAAHNRGNDKEFVAYDENGNERKFKSREAAILYARQHGTLGSEETEANVSTESDATYKGEPLEEPVLDSQGNPVQKRDSQGNPVYDSKGKPVYETRRVRKISDQKTKKREYYPRYVPKGGDKPNGQSGENDNMPPSRRKGSKDNDNRPPSRRK